jgi:hypothetical protein
MFRRASSSGPELALTFVLVWMDSALEREAVWERVDHQDRPCRRGICAGYSRSPKSSARAAAQDNLLPTPEQAQ